MAKKQRKRRKWKKVITLAPEKLSEYLSEDWQKRFNSMQQKSSVCPSHEDCNKKACIENYRCCNEEYWRSLSDHVRKTYERIEAKKTIRRLNVNLCVKKGEWCDKKEACYVLGCIFKVERFQKIPDLINALRGPHTAKQVVELLKKYDPEPMASYYPRIKNVKK